LKIDSFEQYFHPSWWIKLKPFLETKEFEEIWNKIKALGTKGKIVYPYSKLLKENNPGITNTIFEPFKFDFNELQILIFSELSSKFTNDNSIGSILNIDDYYNAIERTFYNGLNLNMTRLPNLDFLKDSGVMILGNSLTSEVDLPHYPIWEPFIKEVFKIIKENCRGLHIILLGENTHRYSKDITADHYVYKSDINYSNTEMFALIKDRVKKNNNLNVDWDFEPAPF
jgi:uracil DNA glycosylase